MVSHESFNRARNGFCAPPEEKSSLFLVMATREALFLVLDGCGDCPTPKLRLEVDSIRFTNVETSISSRRRLRRLEKRGSRRSEREKDFKKKKKKKNEEMDRRGYLWPKFKGETQISNSRRRRLSEAEIGNLRNSKRVEEGTVKRGNLEWM